LHIAMALLNGRDAFCVAATNAGKSLSYYAPVLLNAGRIAIVICPLNVLIEKQVADLVAYKIRACYLSEDQMEDNPGLINKILTGHFKQKIGYVVVNEAHLVIDWGSEFRKEYACLYTLRHVIPNVPWVALTATANPEKV
ncbi:P-loop containing nucleoside triphosphate hydrolase protein, partial [Terfezia boudieri ATCC MYA-4762]